jgi:Glycosyl transferase family 2
MTQLLDLLHIHDLPTSLNQVALPETLPPIVIVAFTRPELLQQVLTAIAAQTLQPPQILAYLDGGRGPQDEPLVQACIDLLQEFNATIPVKIVARPQNLGCDRNVITTITEVLAAHPAMVYLEDDVVPNPGFYDRICRLLSAYRDRHAVFSVSAYANFPNELKPHLDRDFFVSNRIFALGFATWADRWQAIDLANQPPAHNPFGDFRQIPPTIQTRSTIVNQFFMEKNKKTDWVITMTLAALHRGYVHIIPTASMVYNIGFGHAEAVNYRDAEPDWANANYDANAYPDRLPLQLELPELLARPLSGAELAQHLQQEGGLWLSPQAVWYFLRRSTSWQDQKAWLSLFADRFLVMLRRWKSGRSI